MAMASFRSRLIIQFLLIAGLILFVIVSFNFYHFKKRESILDFISRLDSLYITLLTDFQVQNEFFSYETSNATYFITGNSDYLNYHEELQSSVLKQLKELSNDNLGINFRVNTDIDSILLEYNRYSNLFYEIVELIHKRGFKDWGIVGQMRHNIHKLQRVHEIDQTKILSLRRREKDYIIRNEQIYIQMLNEIGNETRKHIQSNNHLTPKQKDTIQYILDNYIGLFNEMVLLDNQLGIKNNTGLKKELNDQAALLDRQIKDLILKSNRIKALQFKKLKYNYLYFIILIVTLSIVISIFNARKITRPIKKFIQYIHKTKDHFKKAKLMQIEGPDEIKLLNTEFNNLIEQIKQGDKQRDIAEHALKESENKYRNLAELLPLSIFEADREGKLVFVNKAWYNTLGYNRDEFTKGVYLNDILSKANLDELKRHKNIQTNKFDIIKKNGEVFAALIYVNDISVNNVSGGMRGVIIDITEREKNLTALKNEKLRAERADQLKSAFLANMSHEIRTPMNAIIGFSDLLRNPDLNQKTREEYIGYINSNGESLLNLINDILDIAKIEAHQLKIRHTDTDINEILNELFIASNEIKNKNNKKNVEIRKNQDFFINDLIIKTDPLRFKQIFYNLIMNAIKFTEQGYVEFGYFLDHKLTFFVRDTGIGLPKDKLDEIFERFRKVDEDQSRVYGGAGLGLSISKQLLNLLGGEIWVESDVGKGSAFYFTLPFIKGNLTANDSGDINKPDIAQIKWEDKKVLIAEDDDTNFLYLETILQETGMSVHRAKNGDEAVKIYKEMPSFDMVLMDIKMPGTNGFKAIEEISALPGKPKILVQTAFASFTDEEKQVLDKCSGYIVKPINKASLLHKMKRIFDFEISFN